MVIKKLLNFISGIGTPAAAFYLLRGYWQFRTWNRLLVAAFAGALLLYLLTGGDGKYRYMAFWKRFLRLFLFPVIPAGLLMTFSGFYEGKTTNAITYLVGTVIMTAVYFALFKPGFAMSQKALDNMDGRDFEEYCAKILRRNGYRKVEVTQASNDYGADITARKHGEKWVIQCKRYQTPIGNSSVQEVVAAMSHYDAQRAAVMTNSTFTRNAIELAMENDVLLVDGEKLQKMSYA